MKIGIGNKLPRITILFNGNFLFEHLFGDGSKIFYSFYIQNLFSEKIFEESEPGLINLSAHVLQNSDSVRLKNNCTL